MFVLENSSADPLEGEFIEKGKICDKSTDKWAIDGTVFKVADKLYFIWSGWEGDVNDRQILYIAPMSDPFTISGSRVEISRPTYRWEKVGKPLVNEGPEIVIRGMTVNLIYSASGSWTGEYCLGLLTAKADSDLLSPSSWKKHPEPVFRSGNGIFGPGHASFVKSPDGREDWIVYHAAQFQGAGRIRSIRTQQFQWSKENTLVFGVPVSPNVPIRLPSGEPAHERYEGERGKMGGGARIVHCLSASGGMAVGGIDTPESYLELAVKVEKAGTYVMSVRFGDSASDRKASSHKVSVNGKFAGELTYANPGRENWSNAFMAVDLDRGINTVRFSKGNNVTELDCIDIFPRQVERGSR